MNIIMAPRCSGKTTELYRLSQEKQIPIVVRFFPRDVQRRAQEMGYNIPRPLRYDDPKVKECGAVLVDDAEFILQSLLGCEVDTMAMSWERWPHRVPGFE